MLQQIHFVVAPYGDPAAIEDRLQHLARKGAAVDQVAGDDDPVDGLVRHVGDDGFQRGQVAVNVRQDGQAGHARRRASCHWSRRLRPATDVKARQ